MKDGLYCVQDIFVELNWFRFGYMRIVIGVIIDILVLFACNMVFMVKVL